jgi:hypothetical protein
MSAIMARPGDLALAQLCARLYATTAPGDWRRIWLPEDDDGVCVALAHIGDWDVVVDRGSTTLQDWLRDFQALPHAIIDHPLLGPVHPGFLAGMDRSVDAVLPFLGANVICIGHSLAAARCQMRAALMKALGRAPVFLMAIAPPRVGFQPFVDYVAGIDAVAWRNGDLHHRDLVTELPFSLPGFPFAQRPLTDIYAPPPPNDEWGLLAWHHLELYIAGIAVREAVAA